MCTQTRQCPAPRRSAEIASSKSWAVDRVDREGRQAVQVAARRVVGGRAGRSTASRAARSTPAGSGGAARGAGGRPPGRRARRRGGRAAAPPGRAPPRRAPAAGARGDRAGRRGRARRSRGGPRPKTGSPVRKRPRASSRTTSGSPGAGPAGPPPRPPPGPDGSRAGATDDADGLVQALVGRRGGHVLGRDVGQDALPGLDAAAAEVAPVGREVLAGGDVQRAAVGAARGPAGRRPCRTSACPTTFARSRSCSAPVTISEADAVPLSTRTTSGAFGTTGLPVARSVRAGTARPRVVTIGPSSRNALATSWASLTSPPPLSRRSRTNALAPLLARLLQRLVDLGVRAGAERAPARTTPTLQPPARSSVRLATTGTLTVRAVERPRDALAPALPGAGGRRCRRALDQAGATVSPTPRSERSSTATIEVARAQAGALGRRAVVDDLDAQPERVPRHRHADAAELAVLVLAEAPVVLRGEVAREAVAERSRPRRRSRRRRAGPSGSRGSTCRWMSSIASATTAVSWSPHERGPHRARQPVGVAAADPGARQSRASTSGTSSHGARRRRRRRPKGDRRTARGGRAPRPRVRAPRGPRR